MDDYKKIEEIKKKPEKNEIQIYMEEDTESETEEEDICISFFSGFFFISSIFL